MRIDLRVLRAHPFLSLIPRFTLRRLLTHAPMEEYPKGTVLFREGEPCEAVYLIFSGRCAARQASRNGGEGAQEMMGPGDTLGDRELLHGDPYRSTVTVATDSVLVRFAAEKLRQIFKRNPAIAGRVSESIAGRVESLRAERARSTTHNRRIVTVLSISPEIDTYNLVSDLASELAALGEHSVLLVRLMPGHDVATMPDADSIMAEFSGTFQFADRAVEQRGGYRELRLGIIGDAQEAAQMAPLLSHFGMHFEYVLIHVHSDTPVASTLECLIQSDLTYLLLTRRTEYLYDSRLLFRQVAAQAGNAAVRIRPILCTDGEGSKDRDFERAMRESGHPVHVWFRDYPRVSKPERGKRYGYRLRSLAREVAGCRVGLALSSGGAKGLAHIGVIQILEEHGVEIDMIAGSSMGAYVGAVWAAGFDGGECEKIARSVPEGRWGLLSLIQPELPPRRGFLNTGRVAGRLRRSLDETRFSDLRVPLRVVATYLDTLQRVVFSTGDVVRAVEASIAIPGVCVPVTREGDTFVDGGIVDPLPVDVLQEAGINRIIAVNTIPTPDTLSYCIGIEHETVAPRSRVKDFLNRHLNYFASGNVLDTMLRSISGAQTQLAEAACAEADIVLRPVACDGRWHDFSNPGRYIALGRKVAEDQIEEIQALVPKRTGAHHVAEIAA